jgi:hypothetical protein
MLFGLLVQTACQGSSPASDRVFSRSQSSILGGDSLLQAPTAAQRIRLTVESSSTPGPGPGFYTYTYIVTSECQSDEGVTRFGVARVPRPHSSTAPFQWEMFYGYQSEDSAVVWAVTDTLTPPPPGWGDNLYPSPYEIQACSTKTYSFVSRRPPTTVTFYAQGFDTLAPAGTYSMGEAGGDDYPTLFSVGVSGDAVGPDIQSVVGVESSESPTRVELRGPSPNPSGGLSSLYFYLGSSAKVELRVYDVHGRLVRELINGQRPLGYHVVTWNGTTESGTAVAAGVYLYRLTVGGKVAGERKVVLVR